MTEHENRPLTIALLSNQFVPSSAYHCVLLSFPGHRIPCSVTEPAVLPFPSLLSSPTA